MTRALPALAFVFGVALLAAAQDAKSPLEKLDPAKLPAAVRPGKGVPKEVIAVLAARGDKVDCLAFRHDGKQLAISGPDQVIRLWSLAEMRLTAAFRQPTAVVCLAFSRDHKTLFTGDEIGTVRMFSLDGTLKTALVAHKDGPAWCVAVSADGKKLATGGRDKVIKVWDVSKPKTPPPAVLTGHGDAVRGLAFSPDGGTLLSAGYDDKQLRVWNMTGDKPAAGETTTLPGKCTSVAFSPDGKKVVTAGAPDTNRVWEFKQGKPQDPAPLATDNRGAFSASFTPDGSQVVCAALLSETEDRVVVTTMDSKAHDFKYGNHVHAVAAAPDGKHLAAVTESGTFLIRLPK